MSEEEFESPYCEVCGHCGEIGCCGIRNFINQHIEGKTNCKNEGIIINELIDLCDYKDEAFEENKKLKSQLQQKENIIKEVRELCEKQFVIYEVNSLGGKIKIYAPISTDKIMEILGDNDE